MTHSKAVHNLLITLWCRIEKNCIIYVFKKHRVTHHLYADDKQGYVDVPISNIATARTTLQYCVFDVSSSGSSRRLQLNTGKPELIMVWHKTEFTESEPCTIARVWLYRSASCAILAYCLTVKLPWSITFQKLQILASINYVDFDSL